MENYEQRYQNITRQSPNELGGHARAKDIIITGMTGQEAAELFGETQFDYEDLKVEFKKLCSDFGEPLSRDSKSYALHFCAQLLFVVGPESRRIKKSNGDKTWIFRFIQKVGEVPTYGMCCVSTYKCSPPPNKQPKLKDNKKLFLTVKQASLLATETLCQLIRPQMAQNITIMTPLANGIFPKDDIEDLIKDLRPHASESEKAAIIASIIQSCQSGGQYLTYSKCHIAVCVAVVATMNVKDRKVANAIIRKTCKEYVARGKLFDRAEFNIYARYAAGGVPTDFVPDELLEAGIQKLNRRQLEEVEASTSRVFSGTSISTVAASGEVAGAAGGCSQTAGPSTGAVRRQRDEEDTD